MMPMTRMWCRRVGEVSGRCGRVSDRVIHVGLVVKVTFKQRLK